MQGLYKLQTRDTAFLGIKYSLQIGILAILVWVLYSSEGCMGYTCRVYYSVSTKDCFFSLCIFTHVIIRYKKMCGLKSDLTSPSLLCFHIVCSQPAICVQRCCSTKSINPLGPRTTKVVNASRIMHGLELLLTLLSPPRTSPKLRNFRSAFLELLARSIFFLYIG